MTNVDEDISRRLIAALDAAKRHEGDYRAMRVTMECGHLRLMPRIHCVMGIGAQAACRICPSSNFDTVMRTVVNVEETGTLHDEWSQRVREGLPTERP